MPRRKRKKNTEKEQRNKNEKELLDFNVFRKEKIYLKITLSNLLFIFKITI